MRATASLHADLTAWLDVTFQVRDPAGPRQTLSPSRTLCAIDAVHLKDQLGQIHTHASKLHDDPSSFRDWLLSISSLVGEAIIRSYTGDSVTSLFV